MRNPSARCPNKNPWNGRDPLLICSFLYACKWSWASNHTTSSFESSGNCWLLLSLWTDSTHKFEDRRWKRFPILPISRTQMPHYREINPVSQTFRSVRFFYRQWHDCPEIEVLVTRVDVNFDVQGRNYVLQKNKILVVLIFAGNYNKMTGHL